MYVVFRSQRAPRALLCASLLALFAFETSAQARWGVHPSVGPVMPPDPSYIHGQSPRFNPPDGAWNYGEGFIRTPRPGLTLPAGAPADTGGYLSFDDGQDVVLDDVQAQGGWRIVQYTDPVSGTVTDLLQFRGFLAPHEFATPADGFEAESAFEVLMPATMSGDRTVLLLATYATMARAPGVIDTEYPGHPANRFADPNNAGFPGAFADSGTGLFLDIRRPTDLDRIAAMSGSPEADGIDIVTAFAMPSVNGGHLTITAQRMLQIERAIQLMLDPAYQGPLAPPTTVSGTVPLPVCAMGGSNGGHVVQFLATHFPDRVHGAYSNQFSATMRHTSGFQEVSTYVTTLQGFSHTTEVHGVAYNLPYSAPYSMLGFSNVWATGPTLQLWSAGLVKRPLFLHGADEDTVWLGGHELFPLLTGGNWKPVGFAGGTWHRPGRVFWSMIDKGTHQPRGVFTLPDELLAPAGGGGDGGGHPLAGPITEPVMAVLPFLDEVAHSFDCDPPATTPRPTEEEVMCKLFPWFDYDPDRASDPRLDPFDHALARKSTHERREHLCAPPPLLTEDPTFRRGQRAIGTGLGIGEALAVDDTGGVWVGSADGVVTRLVRNGATDPTLHADALVVDKRCRYSADDDPVDGPFSLGYGVYGLAVGHGHLAIATHRRLFVYDLEGNPDLAGCTFCADLSWNEQRPSELQLVDDLFGDGGVQLMYLSYLGELVVRDLAPDLPRRAWLSDPGASDFEVGTGHPVDGFSRPIYLATRGHLLQVLLDGANPATFPTEVRVRAASALVGAITDLEWGEQAGQPAITALFGRNNVPSNGIAQFDPDDLSILTMWDLPPEFPLGGAPQIDVTWPRRLACLEANEVVALGHAELFYAPDPSDVVAYALQPGNHANVINLPSIYFAVGLTSGDVGQDGEIDVVVATESGQVVYIPRSLFISGQVAVMAQFVLGNEWFFNGIPPAPERWSTGSVAATWGMTWGPSNTAPGEQWLQVVDQCARRWEIDPGTALGESGHGVPRFRNMVRDSLLGIFPVPATKPFRDLLFVDRNPASILTFPDYTRDVGPSWLPGQYFQQGTRPHVAVATPDNPVFLPFAIPVPPNADITGEPFVSYSDRETYQLFENGYMPIAWGGDMVEFPDDPGRLEAYFWQGSTDIIAPDLAAASTVQGVTFPGSAGGLPELYSSSTKLGSFAPQQTFLRNPTAVANPHSTQSLRLGVWDGQVKAVVGTAGGGVLVLDPDAAPGSADAVHEAPTEVGDHGFGGMALCVEPVVDGSDEPTIFFGTVYGHGRKRLFASGGHDIVSSLHVYSYEPGPDAVPQKVQTINLRGWWPSRPKAFGVCGLKAVDLCDDAHPDGVSKELVVTTLDGDLMVFALRQSHFGSGVRISGLLHHSVHDGALGANNAILVDETADPRVLFVGGSCGMHRFTVTGDGSCCWWD